MNKTLTYSLAALAVGAGVLLATASRSYIVDPANVGGNGCNDTWTGTVAQPLCTVAKGMSLAKTGEGVFLRAGVYPSFTVTKSGLTIARYENEKAIVNGGSTAIKLLNVEGVTIYGLEVTGATGGYTGGIHVFKGGKNVIENNVVHDNKGRNTIGIFIEDTSNNIVKGNTVYNNFLSGIEVISHATTSPNGITGNQVIGNTVYANFGGSDSDGIKLEGVGTQNTLIKDNVSYGNADDGIDTWNAPNNLIVGNTAHSQNGMGDGNGFKLGGGTGGNNVIKNNIAYNNKSSGFDSNGTGGNVYYNNVAYNNKYGFEDGWKNPPCTPTTCKETYINNIGYNNRTANFAAGGSTAISHNNIWYSDSGAKVLYNYAAYSTLAAFYAASGLDNPNAGELSSLQVDPRFVNAASGLFDLLPNSPAINSGDPSNPAQMSAVGRVDIGAIEFGNAPVMTSTPIMTSTPTITPTITVTVVRTPQCFDLADGGRLCYWGK
jgi:parallel beta-helix repeat protein